MFGKLATKIQSIIDQDKHTHKYCDYLPINQFKHSHEMVLLNGTLLQKGLNLVCPDQNMRQSQIIDQRMTSLLRIWKGYND